MKIYIKQILSLLFISLIAFSCETENYTGDSSVNFEAPTVTFSSPSGNDITVQEAAIEGENVTFTIEATIPEPLPIDLNIDLSKTGGSATDADFSTKGITIPAYATSGSGTVTINKTGDLEGVEDLVITANAGNSANMNGSDTFNFSIEDDYLNDNFQMTFSWCNDWEVEDGGTTLSGNFGDQIDLDIIVAGGATSAATGDCPEVLEFGGLDDGTYTIAVQIYENNVPSGLGLSVPLEVTYFQEFFIPVTPFEHTVVINSDMASGLFVIAKVTKVGHEYSVATP